MVTQHVHHIMTKYKWYSNTNAICQSSLIHGTETHLTTGLVNLSQFCDSKWPRLNYRNIKIIWRLASVTMSSLHKRLVHRSAEGCCICRAKSSSSRFTASGKYEQFFTRCFQLGEDRGGDICNACVLLVKRFKKLPLDTAQHWAHVVDARCDVLIRDIGAEIVSFTVHSWTKSTNQENILCTFLIEITISELAPVSRTLCEREGGRAAGSGAWLQRGSLYSPKK